jgi:hypothetical protein
MTIIELFLIGVHCHTKFPKKMGPQNIFRIFEAQSRAHQNSRKCCIVNDETLANKFLLLLCLVLKLFSGILKLFVFIFLTIQQ